MPEHSQLIYFGNLGNRMSFPEMLKTLPRYFVHSSQQFITNVASTKSVSSSFDVFFAYESNVAFFTQTTSLL
jgi:hypothetical protein